MLPWRNLLCLLTTITLTGALKAQTVDLTEAPLVDNFYRVTLDMKLKGKTKVQQEGKILEHDLAAEAQHQFLEKILEAKTLEGSGILVEKTARIYKEGRAVITFNNKPTERTFRPDRTFLVTERKDQTTLTYCPEGSLTREELELTEHFNTLALTGLLPGKKVNVGDSWKVHKEVAQVLSSLEGLVNHDLTCKLEKVQGKIAHISLVGTIDGIDLGVAVKVLIKDSFYQFDLESQRLTALTWKQSEERGQGPASPALSADVSITVTRSTMEEPPELNRIIIGAKVPTGKVPAEMTNVVCAEPAKRFEAQHGRDWIMTSQGDKHTVLRLMKRGAFVAQVTLTPWPKLNPGDTVPFDTFLGEIKKTPTWEEEKEIGQDPKVDVPHGHKAYRYAASGKLDGQDAVQYFYMVAGPQGDHLIVTFTMDPKQVNELGIRDLDLVRSITFPSSRIEPVNAVVPNPPADEKKEGKDN
jgi:hypothetical protein